MSNRPKLPRNSGTPNSGAPVPLGLWLTTLAETCESHLSSLPDDRQAWLLATQSPDVYDGYMMGMADALHGVLANLDEAKRHLPVTMN